MVNSVILGVHNGLQPSSAYRFLGFGTNSASDAAWTDQSGKGNHATLGANLAAATAWGTGGRNITSEDVTAGSEKTFFQLPFAAWDWDCVGRDSFLIAMRSYITTPASNSTLMGNSATTDSRPGIRMRSFTSHKTDMQFRTIGSGTTLTATTGLVSAASPSEKFVCWTYNSSGSTASIYIDGEVDVANSAVPVADYTPISEPFDIGGGLSGSATWVGTATSTLEFHLLIAKRRALPSNIATLVRKLYRHRYIALTESEFPG